MVWEESSQECRALENGRCIGTDKNPMEDPRLKKVGCVEGLVCVQMETLPPGVGNCAKKSPEDNNNQSGGMTLTVTNGVFMFILSIFVHAAF